MTSTLPELAPDLSAVLEKHADRLDVELIERALRFSASAHRGQKRMSGEDFVSHSIAVALILAEQLLDTATIVRRPAPRRRRGYRRPLRGRRAGVRQGDRRHRRRSHQDRAASPSARSTEEQVENYRKLLLSIAKDARVIIIKLADRLHNMRTLEHLPAEKPAPHRAGDARDLRAARAPLRHGEDAAGARGSRVQVPRARRVRDAGEAGRAEARRARGADRAAARAARAASSRRAGIDRFEVTGRPKHLWSIYQKMKKRDKPYEEIYDLLAIRVLVNIGARLLPRARRDPRQLDAAAGADQGLHRAARSRTATSRCTRRSSGPAASSTRSRSAPARCTAPRSTASRRTGCTRRTRRARTSWIEHLQLVPPGARAAARHARRRTSSSSSSSSTCTRTRSSSSRRTGDVMQLPEGRARRSTSRSPCTPRSGCSCQGAKINGRIAPAAPRAQERRHGRDPHRRRRAKPSRDWLAHVRTARARHKIRQWVQARGGDGQPRARAGDPRARGAAAAGSSSPTTPGSLARPRRSR